MNQVQQRIAAVATSRNRYLNIIRTITEQHAQWQPAPDVWNVVNITEHLFWAEQGALFGMWKTLYAKRNGNPISPTEAPHDGLSIEAIIEKTWQQKEIVPAVAAPRMGGTLAFWAASLAALQGVLETLGADMTDDDLTILAHPHPISGVLDFGQRIDFLRFHINRHIGQVEGLMQMMTDL